VPTLRLAELETLFTANVDQIAKAEKTVQETGKRVESKPITAKVDIDAKGALASMDRVEDAAKRIVTAKTLATVDANVDRAEKSFMKVYERLDYLKSVRADVEVEADIRRAEASLSKIQRSLDGLRSARAVMEVDADASAAEAVLDDVADQAEDAGAEGGKRGGQALVTGIVAGLATVPIVGAVAKIAESVSTAVAEAFRDGLAVEAGVDRLAGLAGISENDALRLGRAAGEAYANVFGESIEANMDTARLALQLDLIDPENGTYDAQKVIEGLSGIADVLGEDVHPVARAVAQMLRTGIAGSAREAFDILAVGAREGVNVSEDLLDTFNEYSTQFRKLGLDGPQALGLLSQAMRGGARDSDVAADVLKEFAIRASDPAMKEGFEAVGISWDDLNERIARGGPDAAAALDETLDKLRAIEDPALRDAAAMEIFGTQAEDLAGALTAMDLSSAVEELGSVEGAAQRMFDTLASNDATKLEQAQRNVEVAMQGIQGALAAGFADPLAEAAEWVSQNRGPLMQFFLDLANGALDFGQSVVDGTAAGTEALGEFVAGPLADVVEGLAGVIDFFNGTEGRPKELDQLTDSMRDFDDTTADAADTMRTNLTQAIDDARGRLNGFAEPAVALGYLNDASLRLADSIAVVGSETGTMEEQVRAAVGALSEQISAADEAGESQESLTQRYADGTQALVDQMVQSGKTEEEARALIDTILETPSDASTSYSSNASEEQGKVQSLADRITTLPDGSVVVTADVSPAVATLEAFRNSGYGANISGYIKSIEKADGGIVEFMAAGGLTPMRPEAQMVPPNTWRVVGDRGDVSEAYIPLDGSPRSLAILLEAMRRMGVTPMASGGVTAGPALAATGGVDVTFVMPPGVNEPELVRAAMDELNEILKGLG
jgi:polyhydroxyalkanoate synthesis regulator phasin